MKICFLLPTSSYSLSPGRTQNCMNNSTSHYAAFNPARYLISRQSATQQTTIHVGESFNPVLGSWKNINGHGQRSITPPAFFGCDDCCISSSSSVGAFVKNMALMMPTSRVDTRSRPMCPLKPTGAADDNISALRLLLVDLDLLGAPSRNDGARIAEGVVVSKHRKSTDTSQFGGAGFKCISR